MLSDLVGRIVIGASELHLRTARLSWANSGSTPEFVLYEGPNSRTDISASPAESGTRGNGPLGQSRQDCRWRYLDAAGE